MTTAGKYKHQGILQSVAETQNPVSGAMALTWGNTGDPLWVRAKPLSGDERIIANQVTPEATHLIELRYEDNISSKQRFLVPIAKTTLGAAIGTLDGLSITVTKAFPRDKDFLILIETEQMVVTAGSGTTTWTVERKANGTTAATHLDATQVQILAVYNIDNVRDRETNNIDLKLDCIETVGTD